MEVALHETCQQYVARRLSEGWKIVSERGNYLILSSPDGNILRPVDLRNDVETLRPNAPGDETSISYQTPDSTFHWDKVDEATPDEDDTTVWTASLTYQRDLYNLPPSSGSGVINFIKIYARCKMGGGDPWSGLKISLKSNSTVTDGAEIEVTTSYVTYSQQWNTNPAPPGTDAWTWADIDALQIGVSIKKSAYANYCTQVYVEVDYTPPGWTGKISGVTNPAKIMGVDVANIAKVKGVASA